MAWRGERAEPWHAVRNSRLCQRQGTAGRGGLLGPANRTVGAVVVALRLIVSTIVRLRRGERWPVWRASVLHVDWVDQLAISALRLGLVLPATEG